MSSLRPIVVTAAVFVALSASACNPGGPANPGAGGLGTISSPLTTCVTLRRGDGGVVADAAIWSAYPNYNEGAGSNLWTGHSGGTARSLFRFDLSSIPAGSRIVSATASLYVSNAELTSVNVHRVTAPWSESAVTWSSFADAFDASVAAAFPTGGWDTRTFDLTAQVQDWVSGVTPNYGFVLEEDATPFVTGYSSSESDNVANRPSMSVCFDTNGGASTSSTAAATTVGTSSAATTVSSSVATTSASTSTSGGGPGTFRFAVIGDYGAEGGGIGDVAAMVHGWNPDAVLTTGDNCYSNLPHPYDGIVGQYYHDFISPYAGAYGAGSPNGNRFWPILGYHDFDLLQDYQGFFSLPNNGRYYDVSLDTANAVHLFALDGDDREPDGNSASSTQAAWLQARLAASTSCFKIVTEEQPPYCSNIGAGACDDHAVDWPYHAWGADLLISGQRHSYERLNVGGTPYIVNGLGGGYLWGDWNNISPYSVYRFPTSPARYGAQLVTVTVANGMGSLTSEFYGVGDATPSDSVTITKNCN